MVLRTGGMECWLCRKGFQKGEHLRRHERSHTSLDLYAWDLQPIIQLAGFRDTP